MNTEDKKYIRRCFELALLGRGLNSPNPKVGAVIVHNNKIIGEGYHQRYGSAHAEVNAVNSVVDKSLLKESTIYVNLEPCCHYGKTPPCAELLIKNNFKRCVIANRDSNPKVAGGGIKMLQDAGIEVEYGVLEEEGRFLNRRFFCNQEKHRPYIILKFAQSLDGFMDIERKNEEKQNYWITNNALKVWVHKQRSEEDAILVGYNTVLNDNPNLTTRYLEGRNPKRVVFDRDLTLAQTNNIFNKESQTFIFNYLKTEKQDNLNFIKIDRNENHIPQILRHLLNDGVGSLIVEGGQQTLQLFIDNNLWDEAYILTGNTCFGVGKKAPAIATDYFKSTKMVADNRVDFYHNPNSLEL